MKVSMQRTIFQETEKKDSLLVMFCRKMNPHPLPLIGSGGGPPQLIRPVNSGGHWILSQVKCRGRAMFLGYSIHLTVRRSRSIHGISNYRLLGAAKTSLSETLKTCYQTRVTTRWINGLLPYGPVIGREKCPNYGLRANSGLLEPATWLVDHSIPSSPGSADVSSGGSCPYLSLWGGCGTPTWPVG